MVLFWSLDVPSVQQTITMADTSTATQPAAASVAAPQPPAGSATDTATDSTVTPPPLPSGGAGGGAGAGVAATTDTATGATQATPSAAGDSAGAEKPVKHTHGLDLDFDVSAVEAAGINQLREAIHKRQKEQAVALKAKAKAGEVIEMPPPPTDTRLFHFLLARKLDVASAVDKYFAWQDVEVKVRRPRANCGSNLFQTHHHHMHSSSYETWPSTRIA